LSISIKSRKAKGRNFQQWVAQKISDMLEIPWGKDELIRSREMGQSGTDISLIGEALKLFPYAVEIKHQETWAIPSWIKQAKSNQKKDSEWLLFVKKNNEKPIVVIDAEVFFDLYKRLLNWENPVEER